MNCILYTIHFKVYTLHCTPYTVHFILYTVYCTLHTVHCTVYTVHFTLHTLHCTLYTIDCNDLCLQYGADIQKLMCDHAMHFPNWLLILHRYCKHLTLHTVHCTLHTAHCKLHTEHSALQGYNIVTFGLGSKKSLISNFHKKFLLQHDTVVINRFFPSLTIKSILR